MSFLSTHGRPDEGEKPSSERAFGLRRYRRMSKFLTLLLFGTGLVMAGCASSTQQGAIQLPGATTHSGLQVPPDVGERPTQTAAAPQGR